LPWHPQANKADWVLISWHWESSRVLHKLSSFTEVFLRLFSNAGGSAALGDFRQCCPVAPFYTITSLPAPGCPGMLVISQELVAIFPESWAVLENSTANWASLLLFCLSGTLLSPSAYGFSSQGFAAAIGV